MNTTYINALLADASYVQLTDVNGNIVNDGAIKTNLAKRLTQPLADFITANFEVLNQTGVNSKLAINGFSATVWRGKAGTDYAGQTYVSTRGTEPGVNQWGQTRLIHDAIVPSNMKMRFKG